MAAKHRKHSFAWHCRNLGLVTLGSVINVVGYVIYISSNGLLAGGVWGIAGIANHYLPVVPMGIFLAALNVPLLIWGWSKMSLRFALYTVFTILLQTVLLLIAPLLLPVYTTNKLLACIFGGVITGFGSGLVIRAHSSGGGTDVVGIILNKKFDVGIGTIGLICNALVVAAAAFIFGFEPAMYTMVNMFICTLVLNRVLEGINGKRNMMIVTDKGQEMAQMMLHEIGRGVTLMKGEGAFSHQDKDVLFTVVTRFELTRLKEVVREVDKNAFVCINQAYEVMGFYPKKALSFANIEEQGVERLLKQEDDDA